MKPDPYRFIKVETLKDEIASNIDEARLFLARGENYEDLGEPLAHARIFIESEEIYRSTQALSLGKILPEARRAVDKYQDEPEAAGYVVAFRFAELLEEARR